jgi:cation-transporting ATPase 13A2
MSTNPSTTRTRAAYGTSVVDAFENSKTKSIPARRDSAAPLIHTPPIQVGLGEDPLDAGNTTTRFGSYARHYGGGSGINGGQLRSALRRRRNSESSCSNSEEETEDQPVKERKRNVELNSSDEEQSDSEEEEDDDDEEDEDEEQRPLANNQRVNGNDTRISGLDEIPKDTLEEQTLFLEEEDVHIQITGYKFNKLNLMIYRIFSILSFGSIWLICRWLPRYYISFVGMKVPLKSAEWFVFKVKLIFVHAIVLI